MINDPWRPLNPKERQLATDIVAHIVEEADADAAIVHEVIAATLQAFMQEAQAHLHDLTSDEQATEIFRRLLRRTTQLHAEIADFLQSSRAN
ncbi:MAG: hypothetical protein NW223_23995 [Hyphomicrobiaceae bacterium]|nr:hypothetical protein [Hyphomicrobiaceae bacterium]